MSCAAPRSAASSQRPLLWEVGVLRSAGALPGTDGRLRRESSGSAFTGESREEEIHDSLTQVLEVGIHPSRAEWNHGHKVQVEFPLALAARQPHQRHHDSRGGHANGNGDLHPT